MTIYQHHYFKEMRKAAKKSKAFETQRLIKRLKDLRCGFLGTVLIGIYLKRTQKTYSDLGKSP